MNDQQFRPGEVIPCTHAQLVAMTNSGMSWQEYAGMRNYSPATRKADKARAYAADVRARKPAMQVRRLEVA